MTSGIKNLKKDNVVDLKPHIERRIKESEEKIKADFLKRVLAEAKNLTW